MLAQLQALDPTVLGILGAYLLAHVGSILAAWNSITNRLTRIETILSVHERDIDGLGGIIGTEKAKARQPVFPQG